MTAGLDGSFRHTQQDGRLRAGQTIQHGRLDSAAQVRRQPGQGLTQAAVLDADQHLILSGDNHRWFRRTPQRPPPGAALPADRVDQTADAYSPDKRGDVAAPSVGAGFPPQGEKSVLDRVVDHIRHRAPPGQPDGQPASMPVIESGKGLLITARHSAQQGRVIALLGPQPHTESRSRAPMHSLSQQLTSAVPIIHDQISRETGQQRHRSSVMTTGTRASQSPLVPPGRARDWMICAFEHRGLYRVTGGRIGPWRAKANRWGAMQLTATGRRTGQRRSVILGYFEDGPNIVTMAMNGWGEGEPAWWLNLQARPDAEVRLADGPRMVRARAAAGDERSRLWARWRETDKNLDAYAALRSTETAVVALEPRSEAHRR